MAFTKMFFKEDAWRFTGVGGGGSINFQFYLDNPINVGDLTFNQQYVVGRVDIRGYTQGEYRGSYLLAIQSEYRYNFWKRWGAVGFFGLATVFDSFNESQNGKILPGIGTGFRFTAFTESHMNVGLDIAGGTGDWGIYFRIGEAF
jgi:hypothetical protein